MKKIGIVFLAVLILCVPVVASEATPVLISASEKKVILVSDNHADCAVAEALANRSGATIIKTTWGDFEQSVLDTIVEIAPTDVTMIGGPMAVVEEYETRLEDAGINFERVWGQTRQQTSLGVFNKYKEQYKWYARVGDGRQPYRLGGGCPVWYYDNETEVDSFIQQRRATVTVLNYGMSQRFAGRYGVRMANITSSDVQTFGQRVESRIQSRYGNDTWVRSRFGMGPGMMGGGGAGGMMGGY